MAEPFLGEIRMFGFNFPPKDWALCDGQEMPINDNAALYSLLGVTFGGDGRNVFKLPDLRGRTPIHINWAQGATYAQARGAFGGQEEVTLTVAELPAHRHTFYATEELADKGGLAPDQRVLAQASDAIYATPNNLVPLIATSVSETGGGQAHANLQPSLVINFCIALKGEYPTRN
ncbi:MULTISPECIES: phage tail protein [Shewanella]|jgi:microcystin-dependent protein|uniref:phage tail protein n=1 Tax=Shewanella TaxID=22 RepID=UPI00167BC749|nr:tail fiber protein [Shewanella fodinae]MCL2908376.1 tail fiber protein [Shewanella fodinae]GGZ15745.1 tail Collar domain-containing protein [Shewanella fodinae]